MSSRGLPSTTMTSASLPSSIVTKRSYWRKREAEELVAATMACIGVISCRTGYSKSTASVRCRIASNPASVPGAKFTCCCKAVLRLLR